MLNIIRKIIATDSLNSFTKPLKLCEVGNSRKQLCKEDKYDLCYVILLLFLQIAIRNSPCDFRCHVDKLVHVSRSYRQCDSNQWSVCT